MLTSPLLLPAPPRGKESIGGVVCDLAWLKQHDCYQHTSCQECLAEWPAHQGTRQVRQGGGWPLELPT